MYILKKKIPGRQKGTFYHYHYLVKSVRVGGKVVQKHIAYLGKDKTITMNKLKEKGITKKQAQAVEGLTIIEEN